MNITALNSQPVWLDRVRPHFASLQTSATFDVAVIGGGITGLTTAYLLKQAGKRVGVFEKGAICCGDTGHTTAHLTYVSDQRLKQLISHFGENAAQAVWQGGKAAIDLIEQIIQREQIDCHFQRVPGYLHAALFEDRDETAALQEEAKLAQKLGFDAVYHDKIPLAGKAGVEYSNQALFHPVAYLSALAERISGDGSEVYEQSEMTDAKDDHPSLRVNGHAVQVDQLVIATHVPLTGLNGLVSAMALQSKLFGYSTYVVGGTIPSGLLPYGSYNDTSDPYYYLRVSREGDADYVIFGGKDHKTGKAGEIEPRYAGLEIELTKLLPGVRVDHRWSGQVIETNDGLPYIGPSSDHQFIATGFSGNGMTFGTLSGMMACDWVAGRENPWSELFRLNRKSIRGGLWDYVKENTTYPLELVKGYLRTAPEEELEIVQPGEGRILKLDGHRRAVYRGLDGVIHNCSAICTHLGCVVKWNSAEKTWDCPCHGSRFSIDGEVLAGPAESPLAKDDNAGE